MGRSAVAALVSSAARQRIFSRKSNTVARRLASS